jgi:hypothetical protein
MEQRKIRYFKCLWSGRRESNPRNQLGKLRRRGQVIDIADELLYKIADPYRRSCNALGPRTDAGSAEAEVVT